MGKRFIGALVMTSAMTLAVGAGQYRLLAQQRAPQPATAAATGGRGATRCASRLRRTATWCATGGTSRTNCRTSELQRRLAGAEQRQLEP